jgi:FkbM family methyltransferase
VVYDVGANIGFASLALAKRVGRTGRVVAFEPLAENAKLLRSGIQHSRLRNVQVLQYAVSDAAGETIIRVAGNGATASIVWHRNNPQARAITVKTAAIDELVEARVIPPPQFVKIDVEGAEAYVITGMRRTIAKASPVIFVECSDAGRQTSWDILSALHYRCQSAMTRKWITTFEEYRHSDFLWLPQAERPQ